MICYYILISFFIIVLLIFIIPIKIKIKVITNENRSKNESIFSRSYIEIYILRIIRVKRIEFNSIENIGKSAKNKVANIFSYIVDKYINYDKKTKLIITKSEIRKLNESINFEKIYLNLGINFKNMIVNSYVIGILNSILGFFIAKNIDKIKLDDVKYNIYISKNVFSVDIYSIINFNPVHTIIILIKLIFRVRKVDKDYGKRTSNRKSYDDCYDIT